MKSEKIKHMINGKDVYVWLSQCEDRTILDLMTSTDPNDDHGFYVLGIRSDGKLIRYGGLGESSGVKVSLRRERIKEHKYEED